MKSVLIVLFLLSFIAAVNGEKAVARVTDDGGLNQPLTTRDSNRANDRTKELVALFLTHLIVSGLSEKINTALADGEFCVDWSQQNQDDLEVALTLNDDALKDAITAREVEESLAPSERTRKRLAKLDELIDSLSSSGNYIEMMVSALIDHVGSSVCVDVQSNAH